MLVDAPGEQAVVPRCGATELRDAAKAIDRHRAHLELLVRNGPLDSRALGQVAPAARCEIPHAAPGVRGFHPVFPLQGVPDVAALGLPETLGRVGDPGHAGTASWYERRGVRRKRIERRQAAF